MSDNGERIAVLESQMKSLLESVESINSDTKAIKATLTQQRGFIAGMLTILAPLWGLVLFIAHEVWSVFSGASH